ncbi:MAG: hypothetical protein QOI15_2179, partial [Pseudonocardiales bacterium]|nr:hypothetical protein [Pseudonocardiales bacterium]
ARAAAAANAGRDEKPEPAAASIGADEPMPEWERDLLQPSAGAEAPPTS